MIPPALKAPARGRTDSRLSTEQTPRRRASPANCLETGTNMWKSLKPDGFRQAATACLSRPDADR